MRPGSTPRTWVCRIETDVTITVASAAMATMRMVTGGTAWK